MTGKYGVRFIWCHTFKNRRIYNPLLVHVVIISIPLAVVTQNSAAYTIFLNSDNTNSD
jgi:hypothetical protein